MNINTSYVILPQQHASQHRFIAGDHVLPKCYQLLITEKALEDGHAVDIL